jgi:RimJ/RimL family protein N-acetyltransferase
MATRRLTEADTEAYRRVRLRALAEHPDAFGRALEEAEPPDEMAEQLRTRHDGRESFILGAVQRGELVGTVGCSRDRPRKHRHKALIWGMYVVPEARGRSIGRVLLEEAIARARTWPGLEQLVLAVGTHNEPAQALYRACGFAVFGVERRALKLPDRYVDEAHMVLYLDGGPDADR